MRSNRHEPLLTAGALTVVSNGVSNGAHRMRSARQHRDELPTESASDLRQGCSRADRQCKEQSGLDRMRLLALAPPTVGRRGRLWSRGRLEPVETRTFGSRVIYERYGRARDESD